MIPINKMTQATSTKEKYNAVIWTHFLYSYDQMVVYVGTLLPLRLVVANRNTIKPVDNYPTQQGSFLSCVPCMQQGSFGLIPRKVFSPAFPFLRNTEHEISLPFCLHTAWSEQIDSQLCGPQQMLAWTGNQIPWSMSKRHTFLPLHSVQRDRTREMELSKLYSGTVTYVYT